MSYRAGIGAGMARLGLLPGEPHIICDGCGVTIPVANGTTFAPRWFLAGKPPPKWRGVRSHDGSKRWDLCHRCWRGPDKRNEVRQ